MNKIRTKIKTYRWIKMDFYKKFREKYISDVLTN